MVHQSTFDNTICLLGLQSPGVMATVVTEGCGKQNALHFIVKKGVKLEKLVIFTPNGLSVIIQAYGCKHNEMILYSYCPIQTYNHILENCIERSFEEFQNLIF